MPGYFPSRSFTVLCLPKSQGCRPNLATPLPCPTRYTACHTVCGHASRRTAPFTMPLATPIPLFFATPSHDADRRGHSEAEAVSTMTRSCLSPRRLCAAPQRRCAARVNSRGDIEPGSSPPPEHTRSTNAHLSTPHRAHERVEKPNFPLNVKRVVKPVPILPP